MDWFLYLGIFIISFIVSRILSSMIVLSLFFGIPQTIKLRKQGLLFKNAPISPFFKTILLQSLIIIGVLMLSYYFFNESFFIEIVWGFIIGFLSSFELLSKRNYVQNMTNLFEIQLPYYNESYYEFKPSIKINKSLKEKMDEKNNLESLEENAPEKDREL